MKKNTKRKTFPPSKKNNTPIVIPEYYQIVWLKIHSEFEELLHRRYVTEPTMLRKKIISENYGELQHQNTERQYNTLNNLLTIIENNLKETIERRPAFYWIHIYRRIAPFLSADLGNNTSESTTVTVRNHAEQAILKYGSLSRTNGYTLSNNVDFHEILGGLLEKHLKEVLAPTALNKYKTLLLKSPPQWVLTDFSEHDIADTYHIEGLAYQYWYISAKMRALGKGVKITATSAGEINEERTEEQDTLILSFDERDERDSAAVGLTSNVGTFVPSKIGNAENAIICAFINAGRHTAKEFGIKNLPESFSPNYLPWFINSNHYFECHHYLATYFERKFKFGLLEFCQASSICSHIFMSLTHENILKTRDYGLMFYSKFQRGYIFYNKSLKDIKNDIRNYATTLRSKKLLKESKLEDQIDSIVDFLTLDPTKQETIGIWSNGPKYVFIKTGAHYIYDYFAWYAIFTNLFFGLRNYDPKSIKGVEFEYSFGDLVKNSGFEIVIQSKEITYGDNKREVDVAVRIEDNLYLFECRAFERPLNFFIGNPKTTSSRCEDLEKKLQQANTLAEFVVKNKVGNNYNFEWAENVYSAVVSPYTEWIWSNKSYYWTKKHDFPRIMSANEAIRYLENEKSNIDAQHHNKAHLITSSEKESMLPSL